MEAVKSTQIDAVHPSILPTEPTEGGAIYAGSADRLADGENSLFDKGLIETA